MLGISTRPWTSAFAIVRDAAALLTSPPARYALLQLFSKFGKVSKLDYLFHKAGPLKGKPRGYAFVEYSNRDVRPFLRSAAARAHPGFLSAWQSYPYTTTCTHGFRLKRNPGFAVVPSAAADV